MKQSPTMSKVLIVFLLASWNISLPVSFTGIAVLEFAAGTSALPAVGLLFIRSVLILLVRTQII